jgi:hypothetical protein
MIRQLAVIAIAKVVAVDFQIDADVLGDIVIDHQTYSDIVAKAGTVVRIG